MLVISSPSGAGKTSVCKRMLESDSNLTMSISVTTRPMRSGEVEGKDYHFVTMAQFKTMVKNNDFLEHAEVFGNYYGTPKAQVMECLAAGKDILFDVDWKGAASLQKIMGQDLASVFILPPSLTELERRLFSRNQDDIKVIEKRMLMAVDEISHWQDYKYVVINYDLVKCVSEIQAILLAERLKSHRQVTI